MVIVFNDQKKSTMLSSKKFRKNSCDEKSFNTKFEDFNFDPSKN
jgi:hypothetical protein